MNIFKLSYNFAKKYTLQYIQALSLPVLAGVVGLIFFAIIFIKPALALFGLLSIPFMCWGFWKGYVITYGLCECANRFQEGETPDFKSCLSTINEGDFAKYIGFFAILTIVLYIPSFFYTLKTIPFNIGILADTQALIKYSMALNKALFINTLILAPFLNYALQAYYFKKEKENYFNLLLNCYLKLDFLGAFIALIITAFIAKLSELNPLIYIVCALFFNMFFYSINTFWYKGRN